MIRPGAPYSLLVANPQPPTRRRILDRLRNGPQTTGKLAAAFPALSRFAIMQHLTVLTHAKLVLIRREGRHRINCLNPIPLQLLYDRWVQPHARPLARADAAFKSALEGAATNPQKAPARPRPLPSQ